MAARGTLIGVILVVAVSAALVPLRSDITRASPALALVIPIVVAGLAGSGRRGAVAVAVTGALAFNVVFIPPFWTLKIDALDDGVALVVFVAVALVVGTLVAREGERRQSAEDRAAELQLLNDELRAMEAERTRLAEEATRAAVLERVDEQRAALLRSVSHDLRTPLATIRAVVSDLTDAPYDDETRAELLTLVGDEAERLDRLVANLLSLSRIEAGALKPDRQAVAVDELLSEAVRRLSRLFTQCRVQVDVPRDVPLVDGDFTQLEQVVCNLLENAARHAPPGSTIRVGSSGVGARSSDVWVDVWVDDDGPGVAPFERERIFEPFRRGDMSAGPESSGIGLATCKAIVEAHGGVIVAEGAPGGGARFRFRVPARVDG